jgi:CDP-diacylglycerol pyrophosphatase
LAAAQARNVRSLVIKVALGFTVLGFASLSLGLFSASPGRLTLWLAIRACVIDFRLTRSPFPCLRVDLTGGEERGYVVLRAPLGPSDTILSPTRRVIGLEDPWLRSREAPNYFAAAWRARPLLAGRGGKPPEPNAFALAANSALMRSQEQFHIHLGCLAPALQRWLPMVAPKLPLGAWTRVDIPIAGAAFWGLRIERADLSDVDPLQLAAEGLGDKIRNLTRLTIIVAGVRIGDSDESVILASYSSASGMLSEASAESMVDPDCSHGSRLIGGE